MVVANNQKPVQSNKQTIVVKLYTPHSGQLRLHRSKARYRVMACGRRWGKTLCVINEIVKFALKKNGVRCLWVSPVYRQCKVVYRVIKRALKSLIVHHSDTELQLTLKNQSIIEFYSATNPDAIRGNGYECAVLDECQDIDADTWFSVVQPTLATTDGWAIFIGTPKGRNFFFTLFQRGNDESQPEWEAFHFPSSDNPYIPKSKIEEAQRDLPQDVFEQEYLAKFLDRGAGAVRGLDNILVETLEDGNLLEVIPGQLYITHEPQPNHTYVIGIDLAKYQDYSVAQVMNVDTRHIDAFWRMRHSDYTEQIKRFKRLQEEYNNAWILSDSTGVGDPVLEMMRKEGINADGFLFTTNSKKMLMEELQLSIEHQDFTMPDIPVMTAELRNLQYKLSPSRLITYEVAKGFHDDTIMSLGLTNHAAGLGGGEVGISVAVHDENDEAMPVRNYENDALLERQQNIAHLLGDIELVTSGGEMW